MCQITIFRVLWVSVTTKMVLFYPLFTLVVSVTKDMINEILRTNAIRAVNSFEITKYFVEFLF